VAAAVVAIVIVVLVFALVVVVARDPGPPPGDVALAYELAWDRLDFDTLWSLSGAELRDGRSKAAFIAAKRSAYAERPELGRLARDVVIEEVAHGTELAVVRTLLELRDGTSVRNELQLAHREGRWQVVAYELQPDSRARPSS
jgi:hypothetical protein